MDAVTFRPYCIVCGREIHGETRPVYVNERLTATAHMECAA